MKQWEQDLILQHKPRCEVLNNIEYLMLKGNCGTNKSEYKHKVCSMFTY